MPFDLRGRGLSGKRDVNAALREGRRWPACLKIHLNGERAFFPWCFYQQPERDTFERLLARWRGIQDYAAYRSKDSDQHNNARAVAHYLRQARCAGNLIIVSLQRFRPRKQSAFMPVMLMRYLWKKPRVST
ncbi:hypothetical protein ACM92B_002212 [Cronobacter dublinensis]|uniref:hypothetical protein n=1 Tax=Cronobacter dublinensis TaxID=413497 RepID=UPI001319E69B|nr:hypothetical protein [Cronobacter dublinensis]